MSLPVKYLWPLPDAAAIYSGTPPNAADRSLLFNGTLTRGFVQGSAVRFNKFSRTVSIASGSNLSAINFTVTGLYNGFPVSETIPGPNNNTVYTTIFFSIVNSVTYNANVTNALTVGYGISAVGAQGVFDWFSVDVFRGVLNIGIVTQVVAAAVDYTLEVTNDDVINVPEANLYIFQPIAAFINATASLFNPLTLPASYLRFKINNATNATGILKAYITQQGVQ